MFGFDGDIEGAIREAVKTELEQASADDADAAIKSTKNSTVQSVEYRAMLGFITPYVERELKRLMLAKIKKIVKYIDSQPSFDAKKSKSSKADFVGRCVFDKQKPVKLIGHGAFGSVFTVDSKRAVKMIKISDQLDMKEFENEVDMMRRASRAKVSPAVIDAFPCYSDSTDTLAGIIVMDKIPGKTLSDWIDGRPPKAKLDAIRIRVESAIERLHKMSIYHHDLHGGNIIVTPQGDPYIVDFGLATDKPERESIRFKLDRKNLDRHEDFQVLDMFDNDPDQRDQRRLRWATDAKKLAVRIIQRGFHPLTPTKGLPPLDPAK